MTNQKSYELIALIRRLSTLLDKNIDLWLKPFGLARTQYVVLFYLREDGTLPTQSLLESLQVEPATLSGVIRTLETKGLVTRVEHASDKRRKDVRLTDVGKQLMSKITAPGPVMQEVVLKGLAPDSLGRLMSNGSKMVENLEAEIEEQLGGQNHGNND
ncbi:MAG: MarR family transcriptional regulator [Candidatus Saccharibacteria bacterium]